MMFKQAKQFDDHVLYKDKTDQLDILDIAEKFINEKKSIFIYLFVCLFVCFGSY